MRALVFVTVFGVGFAACAEKKPKLDYPVGITVETAASVPTDSEQKASAAEDALLLDAGLTNGPGGCRASMPQTIRFAYDPTPIGVADDVSIFRVAQCLMSEPLTGGQKVILVGRGEPEPDASAPDASTPNRGLERAQYVKTMLMARGIRDVAIVASSAGEEHFPEGADAGTWPSPRRVDVFVTGRTWP